MVCAGDILTVATDRKWLSFMRSYPNFIPLSAREVEHIGQAMAPFSFDVLYGHYFDRVIAKDAKSVLEKSIARYIARDQRHAGVLIACRHRDKPGHDRRKKQNRPRAAWEGRQPARPDEVRATCDLLPHHKRYARKSYAMRFRPLVGVNARDHARHP